MDRKTSFMPKPLNIHSKIAGTITFVCTKDHGFLIGFSVIDRGCCGIGRNSGQITCLPFQTPCANRNQYVFWDAFHPTEAVNIILGRRAFNGNRDIAFPMNIQELANLVLEPNWLLPISRPLYLHLHISYWLDLMIVTSVETERNFKQIFRVLLLLDWFILMLSLNLVIECCSGCPFCNQIWHGRSGIFHTFSLLDD